MTGTPYTLNDGAWPDFTIHGVGGDLVRVGAPPMKWVS